MMINEFKEKFSQLLLHYTSVDATIKNPDMPPPLTNQQILDTVHDVLREKLNISLHNFESSTLKTPTNEVVIETPNAPDVLRMEYNHNSILQKRYKNLQSLTTGEEHNKLSNSTNLSSHTEEKMEISDSDKSSNKENDSGNTSPEKLVNGHDTVSKDQEFRKELAKLDPGTHITVYTMVEEAHKSAMKVMSKLEEMRGLLVQPEMRPNRRLSSIMNLPPLTKQHSQPHLGQAPASSNLRTIARAKALRRSVHQLNDDIPVTPTSSRPSLVMPSSQQQQQQQQPLASAKKVSGIAKPASKLPSAFGQHNRSSSTLALTESNKSMGAALAATSKSPSKCQTRSSTKYAHVQSTIPKPMGSALKRKAL